MIWSRHSMMSQMLHFFSTIGLCAIIRLWCPTRHYQPSNFGANHHTWASPSNLRVLHIQTVLWLKSVLLHILYAVPYTQSCDVHSVLWWIHLVLQYTINIIWHTLCAVELHSVLWHSLTVDTIARSVYHSTEFMPQHWLFIPQATALSILHSTGCMQQH